MAKPPRADMHIYLEPELKSALEAAAVAADRSLTAEVRRAIRFYLREGNVYAAKDRQS